MAAAPHDRRSLVLMVVSVATFIAAMSAASVNLALPHVGADLGIPIADTSWVVTSYLLAATVLLMVSGRLGDLVGHKRIYLAGFVLFGGASTVCALADGLPLLVAGRVLQGVGASLSMSTGPALLTTSFPGRERGKALGRLSTAIYAGLTVGPMLGGFLLGVLSWRWIFGLNLPAAFVILALGWRYLPQSERRTVPFDRAGAATLIGGLPLLLFAVAEGHRLGWGSPVIQVSASVGLALMLGFLWVESRVEHPLLDLGMFRSRIFSGATFSAAGNYIALFIPIILLPFYLKEALQFSPVRTGLVLSAQPLVMALVASPAGRLSDRIGSRGLATGGLLVLTGGLVGLTTLTLHSSPWIVAAWFAVMGLGTGVFIAPNSSALMGAAPRAKQGIAGGVMALARSSGMLLGVAGATTLFQIGGGQTGGTWGPTEIQALRLALMAAVAVCLASALAAAMRGQAAGPGGGPGGKALSVPGESGQNPPREP